jgi:hypothetical protein
MKEKRNPFLQGSPKLEEMIAFFYLRPKELLKDESVSRFVVLVVWSCDEWQIQKLPTLAWNICLYV